jgi:hypothetical protein
VYLPGCQGLDEVIRSPQLHGFYVRAHVQASRHDYNGQATINLDQLEVHNSAGHLRLRSTCGWPALRDVRR